MSTPFEQFKDQSGCLRLANTRTDHIDADAIGDKALRNDLVADDSEFAAEQLGLNIELSTTRFLIR